MTGLRQTWLVAVREVRERSRSRAFRAGLLLMLLVVVAVIVLPTLLEGDDDTKDVGFTGAIPAELPDAVRSLGEAVDITIRVHRYDDVTAGEHAVREGDIDVLVVDAEQLEWQRRADEQLQAAVTGAIQLVAVRERTTAAGMSPEDVLELVAPVPVENVELGQVEGRSTDDETAAFIMTVLLFMTITTYGSMVLSGVVEEKSSRVVEVLLARMPARNLLAGKIAGIGLLGLAQMALIVVVAIAALAMADSVDVPAARGSVLAWMVVWFVLGYALYATVFGAVGALASRAEDAQAVAGPVTVVLVAGYFASFATIGSPEAVWAKLVSYFPATAPLAMPNRLAMGAADWWEPLLAVALTLTTVGALVLFGGRVYTGGVLHTGQTLKLRDAWQGAATSGAGRSGPLPDVEPKARQLPATVGALVIAIAAGGTVAVLRGDVIVGVIVAAASFAIVTRSFRAWTGRQRAGS